MANKRELSSFLDHEVFNPTLDATPDGYGDADRRKLEAVHYGSAREIVDNYKDDLHSSTAKRISAELEKLHLPTLPSVEHDFLKLAGDEEGQ